MPHGLKFVEYRSTSPPTPRPYGEYCSLSCPAPRQYGRQAPVFPSSSRTRLPFRVRHGKVWKAHWDRYYINKRRTRMLKRLFDSRRDIRRVFDPYSHDADGLGEFCKVRILQVRLIVGKPATSISTFTIPSAPLLNTMSLMGRSYCVIVNISPMLMANPPSPHIAMTCRPG